MVWNQAVVIVALTGVLASAQSPKREPTPNDTLKSPEVLPDRRVVFRIYAPKASDVSITGDWIPQGRGTGGKLQKDASGVFSITVGPLVPDFYSYSFNVDGVKTLDPKNAMIKQGETSLDNMFEVEGAEAAYEANKPVPHGDHPHQLVSLKRARQNAQHACLHASGVRIQQSEVPGVLSAARGR